MSTADKVVVTVCRADTGDQEPKVAAIEITEPVTEHMPQGIGPDGVGPIWMQMHRDFYRAQAEEIYRALSHALPGGTMDALLGVMALHQASILKVTR